MRRTSLTALLTAAVALQGCAPAPPEATRPSPVDGAQATVRSGELGRSGTLRQEEISPTLRSGPLRIQVTPLVEWVLEAAAPDTRSRLTRLAAQHASALEERAGQGSILMLVSLFSEQPDVSFEPSDLQIVGRGLRVRADAIQPISPGWGSGRIGQRETLQAIYAFPAELDLSREMTVEYQGARDDSWGHMVTRIEAERGKITGW